MYAEVIIDIAHSEVDRIFDYDIVDLPVATGYRVLVPFGRQTVEGFVIGIKEKTDAPINKIKPILKILDEFAAFNEQTLALARYIKDTYRVPFAAAARLFIPSELRGGRVKEKFVYMLSLSKDLSPDEMIGSLRKGSSARENAILKLKDGEKTRTEMNAEFGPSAINALIEKGFVKATKVKVGRKPYKEVNLSSNEVVLTDEQKATIDGITSTRKTVSLLFGVTGSGKTEVYLQLINRVLKEGKTAIMLVPEIALTPQTFARLRSRFGDKVSILHSGLSAGERYDEWLRLNSGEARIAIGARSAVFAPLDNLGIIIVDEEHDGSYEAETSPRYKTVAVAVERARISGAKVVLGSATPSIESFDKAVSGEYFLTEMKKRVNGKGLPDVQVVDMRGETRRGNASVFSSALKSEIQKCLKEGNQAIIFYNRRGYSRQVICRDCGYVAKCKNCDVSLNYHKDYALLKCHYCGSAYNMLSACPECGSVNLSYSGAGTQRIVSELSELFPDAKILRMDNDTTQTKEGHFKILKEFGDRKADILVGTQMVAKGHDFPSVTLVGILDADMSLYFSDYRSGERTFQLITQVAGRGGRADKKGKVVLQTYNPENEVLKDAIEYDYVDFFKREKSVRKSIGFPPFATIVRVMVESEDDALALDSLKNAFVTISKIRDERKENFLFFNKMKCPVKRIKNKFRYQILARLTGDIDDIKDKIYAAAESVKSQKVLSYVEEDPSNLY